MNKRTIVFSALAALCIGVQAKVRLPHIICDNMVLQQQTEARLWGWDKPGKTVKVTTSWSNETVSTKTGKDGKWLVKVKTPKASYEPLSITFDDGEAVTINNVVSGEVWVCAGQSNMEMPVKGFGMCPVKDYNQHVIDAIHSKGVRSVKIPSIMRSEPPGRCTVPMARVLTEDRQRVLCHRILLCTPSKPYARHPRWHHRS